MIKRLLIAMPILLFGWIAVLAIVMRLGADAPGAFIPFPQETLLQGLPKDVAITNRSSISITVQGDGHDLTKRLYDAGAFIVLPAGLEGCIPGFLKRPVTDA